MVYLTVMFDLKLCDLPVIEKDNACCTEAKFHINVFAETFDDFSRQVYERAAPILAAFDSAGEIYHYRTFAFATLESGERVVLSKIFPELSHLKKPFRCYDLELSYWQAHPYLNTENKEGEDGVS